MEYGISGLYFEELDRHVEIGDRAEANVQQGGEGGGGDMFSITIWN